MTHLPGPVQPFLCRTSHERFLLEKTNQENKIALSGNEDFQNFEGNQGIGSGCSVDEAAAYRSFTETGWVEPDFDHTKTSFVPDCLIPFTSKTFNAETHRWHSVGGRLSSSAVFQTGVDEDHAWISLFHENKPRECREEMRSGERESSSPRTVGSKPISIEEPVLMRHLRKSKNSSCIFL